MSVSAPIPEPPPAASKWIDLVSRVLDLLARTVDKGLVPFVLLGLALWFLVEQQKRADHQLELLRADVKESRAETSKAFDRCVSAGEKQSASVKEAVKDVRAEVKAAAGQAPSPAPAQ
jgi:hypothetical protein